MILSLLAACAGGPADTAPLDTAPLDTADDTAAPLDWAADGTWALLEGAPVDGLGNELAVEDLDGDGQADLLVAAYLGNRVCRVLGPLAAGRAAVDTVGTCLATDLDADYAGYGAAPVGDLDGDGVVDVAVGAIGDADAGANAGKVYLLPGTWGAGTLGALATSTLVGETAGDYAGLAVSAAGDLTGDGLPDLLVGASGYDGGEDGGGAGGGRAYVVAGPVAPGESRLADAWASLTGLGGVVATAAPPHGAFGVGDFVGDALAGPADYDGDGFTDLALGASGDATLGPSTGKAVVWFGPLAAGAGSVADADVLLTGPEAGAYAGSPLRALPDLDGDGRAELLVAGDGYGAGVVWVLSPTAPGTSALADAPIRVEGQADGDLFGAAVSALVDLDGDALPDLVVGAPGGGDPALEPGMAWVLLGALVPGVHTLADGGASAVPSSGVGFGDDFGRAVALGDLDGDGAPDQVVGAPISDVGGGFSGGVWVRTAR